MTYTYRELFTKYLPEPYRSQAIANTNAVGFSCGADTTHSVDNLDDALSTAFTWAGSPEGHDYWSAASQGRFPAARTPIPEPGTRGSGTPHSLPRTRTLRHCQLPMKPYYKVNRVGYGREPKVQHATLKEAENESLRLAGQHPGESFEILQCLGTARTSTPVIDWLDTVGAPAPSKLPAPAEHYPTTPLPEGFDRWECRGKGWRIPVDAVWCSEWASASGKSSHWEQDALVGLTGRGWDDSGRRDLVYWEAVKDEPSYRMLEPGERIEEGDEFLVAGSNNQWLKRQLNLGQLWYPGTYAATRRPIKKP